MKLKVFLAFALTLVIASCGGGSATSSLLSLPSNGPGITSNVTVVPPVE